MHRAEHTARRVKLRQLDILVTVTKCGRMAKAAEDPAISQPVVSKAIAELESILGVRLFDRLIDIHPEWRGHSYFVTGDDIVICDGSRNVVAMVPVGSLRLDVSGPDHLAQLFGFSRHKSP